MKAKITSVTLTIASRRVRKRYGARTLIKLYYPGTKLELTAASKQVEFLTIITAFHLFPAQLASPIEALRLARTKRI